MEKINWEVYRVQVLVLRAGAKRAYALFLLALGE